MEYVKKKSMQLQRASFLPEQPEAAVQHISYQESGSTNYSCSMLLESLWEAKVETPEKVFELHERM